MKRLGIALLLTACSLTASAQDGKLEKRKDWPTTFQTAHYEVRSTCTREQARKLADYMDLVYDTYAKLFAIRQLPQKKAVLVLFRDEKEYKSQLETPKGSGAYYDPNIRFLVGFYEEKRMYNVFAHEGTHQFTDLAIKGFDRSPPWFVEGLAECIGNSVVIKGRLFMGAKNGIIAQEDLPVIQGMIKEKSHVPLKDLVKMNQATWDTMKGSYPEAWSFCTFLLAYPKYEETKSQIPNGKYWTVLSNYIRIMSDGKTDPETALKTAFVLNGKPLDFDLLEKEWMDYILKMENSGTLADKEFEIGLGKAEVSAELTAKVRYPSKTKGENGPLDRTRAPYPLLIFTAGAEGAPYDLSDWLAEELPTLGFVTALLPGKGGASDDVARIAAVRDWLLKRNADKDPTWKAALGPVIVVGNGPTAQAALTAGADTVKVAGVVLLAPPAGLKVPDKYKTPTVIVCGDDELEAANKIYGDLKKPRYLFAIAKMDKTFMPEKRAGLAFSALNTWLSYRYAGRDEWKPYVSGEKAQEQVQAGDYKVVKTDE
jgi:hypothetical protein